MNTNIWGETLCSNCGHNEVCSLTKEYLAAQKAVDDLMVHLGDCKSIRLRDIKWIKRVKLECTHYIQKRTIRNGTFSGVLNCDTTSDSGIRCMEDPE